MMNQKIAAADSLYLPEHPGIDCYVLISHGVNTSLNWFVAASGQNVYHIDAIIAAYFSFSYFSIA